MNLSELEDTLPDGFHDADLKEVRYSLVDATASLTFDVVVNDEYEEIEVLLSGVIAFVVDGPRRRIPTAESLPVQGFKTTYEKFDAAKDFPVFLTFPKEIQEKCYSFYVNGSWNSFIHIAATSAEIVWKRDSRRDGNTPLE